MAKHTIITLVDDLDGTELGDDGGQTVEFALDGKVYEIDLSHDNANELRSYMQRYVDNARTRALGNHTRKRGSLSLVGRTGAKRDPEQTRAIREWAVEQGLMKPEARGRIANDVIEKWEQRGQMKIDSEPETPAAPKRKRQPKADVTPPDFSEQPDKGEGAATAS